MKIIHTSLATFLEEIKSTSNEVRVAALMQSITPGTAPPIYASWIVVTAALSVSRCAECRIRVGRQRPEPTERSYLVPSRLAKLTEERLAEVRQRVQARGLTLAHGILPDDAETVDGVLE